MKNAFYNLLKNDDQLRAKFSDISHKTDRNDVNYYFIQCSKVLDTLKLGDLEYRIDSPHTSIYETQNDDEDNGKSCYHFTALLKPFDPLQQRCVLHVYYDREFQVVDIQARDQGDKSAWLELNSAEKNTAVDLSRNSSEIFFVTMQQAVFTRVSTYREQIKVGEDKATVLHRTVRHLRKSEKQAARKVLLESLSLVHGAYLGLGKLQRYPYKAEAKLVKNMIDVLSSELSLPSKNIKPIKTIFYDTSSDALARNDVVAVKKVANPARLRKKNLSITRTKLEKLSTQKMDVYDKAISRYSLLKDILSFTSNHDDAYLERYLDIKQQYIHIREIAEGAIKEGNLNALKKLVTHMPEPSYLLFVAAAKCNTADSLRLLFEYYPFECYVLTKLDFHQLTYRKLVQKEAFSDAQQPCESLSSVHRDFVMGGATLMMYEAVKQIKDDCLRYLLDAGVNPNVPFGEAKPILVHAVLKNNFLLVQDLVLKYHANVNGDFPDEFKSVLKYEEPNQPVRGKSQHVIHRQLKAEALAKIDQRVEDAIPPIFIACHYRYNEIIKFLLVQRNIVANKLFRNFDAIDSYFFQKDDSNTQAIDDGVVKLLLDKGLSLEAITTAPSNISRPNSCTSRLYRACQVGYFPVVKSLLAVGANVNFTSNDGTTPLMMAILSQKEELVTLILSHPNLKLTAKNMQKLLDVFHHQPVKSEKLHGLIKQVLCVAHEKTDSAFVTFKAGEDDIPLLVLPQKDIVKIDRLNGLLFFKMADSNETHALELGNGDVINYKPV